MHVHCCTYFIVIQDLDAQFYLGMCYENGLGVEQDLSKAADLYRQAADEGHVSATHSLGVLYEHGCAGEFVHLYPDS